MLQLVGDRTILNAERETLKWRFLCSTKGSSPSNPWSLCFHVWLHRLGDDLVGRSQVSGRKGRRECWRSLRNRHLSVISGVDTNVYLSWASDRRPPMLILTLADGSDVPVDTNVEMSWLTPTHLELTYKGNQTVGFEAIKWADVEISVRNLASERTQTGAVNLRNGARNLQAPPPFAYRKTTAPQ